MASNRRTTNKMKELTTQEKIDGGWLITLNSAPLPRVVKDILGDLRELHKGGVLWASVWGLPPEPATDTLSDAMLVEELLKDGEHLTWVEPKQAAEEIDKSSENHTATNLGDDSDEIHYIYHVGKWYNTLGRVMVKIQSRDIVKGTVVCSDNKVRWDKNVKFDKDTGKVVGELDPKAKEHLKLPDDYGI